MDILLKNFVREKNFTSIEALFKGAIENKYLSKDLTEYSFDSSENRFFGSNLVFENKILDLETLYIRDSLKIKFKNCVIKGNLAITDHEGPVEVYIDNCIICETLRFYGCHVVDVQINDSNINELDLYNSSIEKINLSFCNIGTLSSEESKIDEFRMFCNKMDFFDIYHSHFEVVKCSGDYLNLNRMLKGQKSNSFDPLSFCIKSIENTAKMVRDSHSSRIETINFLKQHNFLSKNRSLELLANYEISKLSYSSKIYKAIIVFLQGFTKPSLLILYAALTIIFFALFYWKFGLLAGNICDPLSFKDALYFSGITFTTIGYGDIQPVNLTRFIAILEGITGVLLCSSILVSLVNKFTKNN